jgi:predicted nucleic acid-binding protein
VEVLLALVRRGALRVTFVLADQVGQLLELLRRYKDVPMSLADACLVRMAELRSGGVVLTLDSDFTIYRIHGRTPIPLLMPAHEP